LSESEYVPENRFRAEYFGMFKTHLVFGEKIEGCREHIVAYLSHPLF